jgi:ABC-type branched-subunit amino acid transport system substrate-binding protein
MSKITRAMLLGILLVFVLGVDPGGVSAQRPPIKIGFVTDLTGTAAQATKDMVNGLTMYLDEMGQSWPRGGQ